MYIQIFLYKYMYMKNDCFLIVAINLFKLWGSEEVQSEIARANWL